MALNSTREATSLPGMEKPYGQKLWKCALQSLKVYVEMSIIRQSKPLNRPDVLKLMQMNNIVFIPVTYLSSDLMLQSEVVKEIVLQAIPRADKGLSVC